MQYTDFQARFSPLDNKLGVRRGLLEAVRPGQRTEAREYLGDAGLLGKGHHDLVEIMLEDYAGKCKTDDDFPMKFRNAMYPGGRNGEQNVMIPGFREEAYLTILSGRIRSDAVPEEIFSQLENFEGMYFDGGLAASLDARVWYDLTMTQRNLDAWPVSKIVGWTVFNGVEYLEKAKIRFDGLPQEYGIEAILGRALPDKDKIREVTSFAKPSLQEKRPAQGSLL